MCAVAACGLRPGDAGCRRGPGITVLLPVLVIGLAGCSSKSSDDNPDAWYNKTVMEHIAGRAEPVGTAYAAPPPGSSGPMIASNGRLAPVIASDLYRSEASCGYTGAPGMSGGDYGIALEMTECEVARRSGPADKVELTGNERGVRFLTLTYTQGERPRIYRFAGGRLIGIEMLPPPPPPPTRSRASRAGHPAAPARGRN